MNIKHLFLSIILILGCFGSLYAAFFVAPLFNPFIWYLVWGSALVVCFFGGILEFWKSMMRE